MSLVWRKRLTVLIGLLLAAAAWGWPFVQSARVPAVPQAESGVMDLRQWNWREDGPVRLNGRWSLHWNELLPSLAAAETEPNPPLFAEVPGEWNRLDLPGRGYATYRLTVLTQGDTGALGLHVPAIAPAYRLLIDGRVIAETGVVSTDRLAVKAAYKPKTVVLDPPPGQSFDLIIQVANQLYPHGGIWFSLTLGTETQMLVRQEHAGYLELAVFGGCALLGLYQLALFAMRRSERSTLYFGLCCLLGAVRMGAVGGMYIVQLFPETDIRILIFIEYVTYYGGVTSALLFVRELYAKEFHPLVIKPLAWVGFAYIGTVVLLPAEWYTRFIDGYKYVSLISLAYVLFGFALAFWRNREGALLQLCGWLLFIAAALHDILYSNGITLWTDMQLVAYGFILLVFIEAMELARRFTQAYRTIGRMSEQLMVSNRMKDEFLANTSHELKTPLHGIMNLTQALAEEKSGTLNAQQREQLDVVITVARRMSNLINDILDWSRLKNSGIQLDRRPVDIRAVVMAQQEVFRHYIGDKPVVLRFDWPDSLPQAYADESRLLQIVYNLIGNAIKFTPNGEVIVSAWMESGMLHLSVEDTGIGIEASKLETIFLSFEQIGTSVAREYGGAGLGLGIARRLVELHGGHISVKSRVGQGSVFTVTVPVCLTGVMQGEPQPPDGHSRPVTAGQQLSAAAPAMVAAGKASVKVYAQERERIILAVDDDPINLRVLQAVLKDEPYELVTATGGPEALSILDRLGSRIGLVILDVMMPGQSGYETCRLIRDKYPMSKLPVLLTTVRSEPTDVLVGFESGANDYLTKPFQAYELRARTRTLLEMKRSAEEAVRSELAFLQAQIKPHFLYNALNTIITFSLEDPQMAHDLLLSLSRYLRGSFDFKMKDKLVSLRKELELTEAYLSIERARFGERLRIRYEVDETASCMLPPLTLQPLVENAVRHGITKRVEGGTVTISVQAVTGFTVLAVEDDGPGLPDGAQAALSTEREGQGGVGLRNIHLRLLNQFGAGVDIGPGRSGGTRVTFRIPREPGEEGNR